MRTLMLVLAAATLCTPATLFTPATVLAASDVQRLAWLEGVWTGTTASGMAIEEHWTSPAGNGMVGMHKDVKNGRMVGFEFLRIEPRDSTGACYVASPNGAPPTRFCAIELSESRVVFENLEHDFPQRILYWLDGAGRLHARIEGKVRGEEKHQEWTWTRRSQASTGPGVRSR
jgi:hypothetical protein